MNPSFLLKYIYTLLLHHFHDKIGSISKTSMTPSDSNLQVVRTRCGEVEGLKREVVTDSGYTKSMYQFNNIPYAEPPVGKLRWRPPQKISKKTSTCWKGVLKYTNTTIQCKQFFPGITNVAGQEDCLYLDIRTPTLNERARKPVLIWIHGGAMLVGNKSTIGYSIDSQLAASLDVVGVNINYRLNVFGFLSLEELWVKSGPKKSYGNYGIMDQIMALKWIKENIKYFGGDPNQVVIFGHSGGGTAVNALLSSTSAQGLFRKAISASGAPNIRLTHTEANAMYRFFINNTNCIRSTREEIRKCLQTLPADVVVKNSPWIESTNPNGPQSFGRVLTYRFAFPFNEPVTGFPIEIIDPVVLRKSPGEIMSYQNNHVDIAISNTAQEVSPPTNLTDEFSSLRDLLEPQIRSFNDASYDEILEIYKRKHSESEKVRPSVLTPSYSYTVMSTDVLLSCAVNNLATHLSTIPGYNVYRFVISQPPSPINGKVQTAHHGWDMRALFGYQQSDFFGLIHMPSDDDIALKMIVREYYKNFIHSDWKFKRAHQGKTAVFWENDIRFFDNNYHHRECQFWESNGFLKQSWGNLGV